MSPEIQLLLKAQYNEAVSALETVERSMAAAQQQAIAMNKAMQESVQKAGMAMAAAHDEALKMNGAFGQLAQGGGIMADVGQQAQVLGQQMSSSLGPAGNLLTSLGPAGLAAAAALGAVVAVGAGVVAFLTEATKGLLAVSDTLSNMNAETQLSVGFLQELDYAGGQVGVQLETTAAAATALSKNIGEGDSLFQRLGLSLQRLRSMNADEQFRTVAAAIAGIKDPTQQMAAAMEAFGKSGTAVLKLVRSDYQALGEEARKSGLIISDSSVAAADALGDQIGSLGKLWDSLKGQLATAIVDSGALQVAVAALGEAFRALGGWLKDNQESVRGFFNLMASGVSLAVTGVRVLTQTAGDFIGKMKGSDAGLAFLDAAGIGAAVKGWDDLGKNMGKVTAGMPAVRGSYAGLTEEMRRATTATTFITKEQEALQKKAKEAADKIKEAYADAFRDMSKLATGFFEQLEDKLVKATRDAGLIGAALMPGLEPLPGVPTPGALPADVIERQNQILQKANETKASAEAWAKALDLANGNLAKAGALYPKLLAGQKDLRTDAEKWAFKLGEVSGMLGQLSGLFNALGISADSFAAKAVSGLSSMASATAQFLTAPDLLSKIGAGIGLVGSAVSFIGGLFGGKEEWEKVADELSRTFGKEFSEGLAKAIAETEETQNVSRAMAELLNLSEIIDESGQDAREFTTQIGSLFSAIADGAVPATEGIAELGQVFDQVRQAAEEAGVVGDRVMVQMIQQARAMGMQVPEITAAVAEALDQAIQGVSGITSGIQILTPEDAGAQAQIFAATFWAKFQEDGAVAAVQAMSASFEAIRDAAEAGGFDISAILGPIAELMALATEETAPLLDGIMGLQDALEGLANAGYLTMGSFQGVEQQAASAFNQLISQGVDSKVALEAIAPLLAQIRSAAEQYGLELDSVTQGLLAQADAAGIAFPTDPMQQVVSLLEVIAEQLGATLPGAALRAGESMREGFAAGGREATAAVEQAVVDMGSAMDGFAAGQEELAQYVQQQWTSNIQEIPFWLEGMQPLMEDGFNAFADAADPALRRVKAATGGILADLDDITNGTWTVNIQGPGGGDGGSGGGGGTQAPRPPKQAAFGAFVPTRPGGTLFNVGEGGQDEIIAPLQRIADVISARLQGPGGGDRPIILKVYLDGKELEARVEVGLATGRIALPR